MIGLSFVGFALLAYFQRVPLPPEFSTDKLLPYFMSLAFPAGAVGLVIAAIMAASLSSIDSAINSCTSVAVVDLYGRAWRGDGGGGDDRAMVRISRIFTVVFGALGTTLACNVGRIGTLLEINAKVVNAFTGPLFGIFLLAMFSRRAGSGAALAAGVAGALTAYYVAYHSAIGFMWPSTFGLAATLAAGGVLSMASPMAATDPRAALTWRAVMNRRP
jgi:SSS family solute:Na+ symporter